MLPSVPPPTAPQSSDPNDNLWILMSHLSILLGVGLVVPLVVYLVKRDESPEVAYHAKEALNFHLSIVIYSLVCAITCVGIVFVPVIGVAALVFAIIASVKSSEPVRYRYPLTLRLIV